MMMTETSKSAAPAGAKLPPEHAPLRVLPFGAMVRCRCVDCGLEQEESAGRLVNEGQLGSRTAAEYAESLACRRSGCGGALEASVDVE